MSTIEDSFSELLEADKLSRDNPSPINTELYGRALQKHYFVIKNWLEAMRSYEMGNTDGGKLAKKIINGPLTQHGRPLGA